MMAKFGSPRPLRSRVYDTLRWRTQTRPAILARDNFRCVKCGSDFLCEIDHIKPIPRTGPVREAYYDESNLQTLCKSCHSEKTNNEMGGRVLSPEEIEWQRHRKALMRG